MSLTVERLNEARRMAKSWANIPMSSATGRLLLDVIEAYDELNGAITWDTTCLNCARLLDQNYEQYVRMEQAEEDALAWRFRYHGLEASIFQVSMPSKEVPS